MRDPKPPEVAVIFMGDSNRVVSSTNMGNEPGPKRWLLSRDSLCPMTSLGLVGAGVDAEHHLILVRTLAHLGQRIGLGPFF